MVLMDLLCTRNTKTIQPLDINMSPKIQAFKDRAGIYDNPDQEGIDIFAELLVKDIANIVQQYSMMKVDAVMISELIKKTYGVA